MYSIHPKKKLLFIKLPGHYKHENMYLRLQRIRSMLMVKETAAMKVLELGSIGEEVCLLFDVVTVLGTTEVG